MGECYDCDGTGCNTCLPLNNKCEECGEWVQDDLFLREENICVGCHMYKSSICHKCNEMLDNNKYDEMNQTHKCSKCGEILSECNDEWIRWNIRIKEINK